MDMPVPRSDWDAWRQETLIIFEYCDARAWSSAWLRTGTEQTLMNEWMKDRYQDIYHGFYLLSLPLGRKVSLYLISHLRKTYSFPLMKVRIRTFRRWRMWHKEAGGSNDGWLPRVPVAAVTVVGFWGCCAPLCSKYCTALVLSVENLESSPSLPNLLAEIKAELLSFF